MASQNTSTAAYPWTFFRTGGLDQVAIRTGEDLVHLKELDPKLWVALSCPVKGIEIEEKTLALLDLDGDGRIRIPEILAAIEWLRPRLTSLDSVAAGGQPLSLESINPNTPEGKAILASAKHALANLGKATTTAISVEDTGDTKKIFAQTRFNGDGIITADTTEEAAAKKMVDEIIAVLGSEMDRSGKPGITQGRIDQFFDAITQFADWAAKGTSAEVEVIGDATAAALESVQAVRAKVDDYFARVQLAAFDARAQQALNRTEADFAAFASKDLKTTAAEIAALPLAKIVAGQPLPLEEGINPAWAGAIANLRESAVAPLLGGDKTSLTQEDWEKITASLTAYESWLAAKPKSAVESLGAARIQEIASSAGKTTLSALIAQDLAVGPEVATLQEVEKLARYHRDFGTLVRNFVNFADFYDPNCPAAFQAGRLYLDSRSTDLCVRVDGPTPLAAMSKIYIAYCTCSRTGAASFNIAACFTRGDSDYLFVGRRGVFYDRLGRDYEAVVTSIVDNPTSIHQAFWAPYKKFVRMIEEQIAKRAAAKEAAADAKLASAAATTANVDQAKPAEAKKVDVGTVAALGVAVGALTTAFGYFLGFFKGLSWWEIPLVFIGVILIISLPSMAVAWLKLRQRTVGPILEGSGWAINGRVKINIPFGSTLTHVAVLPPGSHRSLEDPYEDKEAAARTRSVILLLILVLLLGTAVWIRWDRVQKGRYFWQPAAVSAAPAPTPAPTAAPAK